MNTIGSSFSSVSQYSALNNSSSVGVSSSKPEVKDYASFASEDSVSVSSDIALSATNQVSDSRKKSEPVTITIISTNDLHGKYDRMPKLAGVVDALREKYPDAILVDGGDSTYNPPASTKNRFEPMTKILNAMDYDIIGLGNHEFQFGKEATVKEFVNKVDADVIAGNVHADKVGGYLENVSPYVIKEVGGVKVAFVSMLEPKMHTKANPHVGKDLVKETPVEAMRRLMPEIEQKADVVVAVTHQGLNDDRKMLKQISGVDLVLAAHDHAITEEPIEVGKYPNTSYIVESGSHCKMVGLSQLTVDPDSGEVIDFQFTNYPVQTFNAKPNEEVAKIIKDYGKL